MNYSDDTNKVMDYLSNYSGGKLRKPDDIAIILELGAERGDADLVNNIVFTGKSIWNMHKSIMNQRSEINSENTNMLEREIIKSLYTFRTYLSELIADAESKISGRFNEVYLNETQGSFRNVLDLAHDLSIFKQMQSDFRRKTNS